MHGVLELQTKTYSIRTTLQFDGAIAYLLEFVSSADSLCRRRGM